MKTQEMIKEKVEEFWCRYDTERARLMGRKINPERPHRFRVARGNEKISKDIVDDFHFALTTIADKAREEMLDELIRLTEACERTTNTSMEEWRGFKCIRNKLRDKYLLTNNK